MKKYLIILAILLTFLFVDNVFAEKYMGDLHEYLFEEGVNLLNKYKIYEEYEYDNGNKFCKTYR